MTFFIGDENKRLELEFLDYEIIDGVETLIGPLDISSATEITFIFAKPDGTAGTPKTLSATEVALTTDGTDGKAYYDTETGFLNQQGAWQRQGVVVIGGKNHYSTIVKFTVNRPL